MKKISKKNFIYIFFLISFLSISFFYLNKDYYKSIIIKKFSSLINYDISFQKSNFNFFPSPGIEFSEIKIQNPDSSTFSNFNSIGFYFSWKIIYGNIILKSITIENGNIFLHSKTDLEKNKTPFLINQDTIKKINSFLRVDEVSIENIKIQFEDNSKSIKEVQIHNLKLNQNHYDTLSINVDLESQFGKIKGDSEIIYEYGKNNFNDIKLKSKLNIEKLQVILFKEYYKLAPEARFDNTEISGKIELSKQKKSNEILFNTNIDIEKLKFKNTNYYPKINTQDEFSLNLESKEILFQSLQVNFPTGAKAKANGNLEFKDNIHLNLNIYGEYADIYKVVELIVYAVDINISTKSNFYSYMKIFCKSASFDKFNFNNADLELNIFNTEVNIKVINANVLNGSISAIGKVNASKITQYEFDIIASEINVEELISKYSKEKYIKGNLNSSLNFNSQGNTFETFIQKLVSNGTVEVRKGELLGYANFMKPIFSLGKLINLTGPKGKNTEFQTLNSSFQIANSQIISPNLKLVGVGIDAKGYGKIGFNRKIDYKINVGLGGFAGKILFVPILYKGIMPDNISYIDPIWIGSVYVGSTFFVGPIGTTVGGIAGSAASEYMDKAVEGIRKIFSFSKKKEEN